LINDNFCANLHAAIFLAEIVTLLKLLMQNVVDLSDGALYAKIILHGANLCKKLLFSSFCENSLSCVTMSANLILQIVLF
jgi:hypothetical protein